MIVDPEAAQVEQGPGSKNKRRDQENVDVEDDMATYK